MDLQRLLAFEGKSYSVLVNGCILEIVICVHCVKQTNWPWRGDRHNTIMIFMKIQSESIKLELEVATERVSLWVRNGNEIEVGPKRGLGLGLAVCVVLRSIAREIIRMLEF